MSETDLILMLQIIKQNAGVESLLKRGLRYSQIFRLLSAATEDGLVVSSEQGLAVTEKGLMRMKFAPDKGQLRKDGGWISPEEESRIEKVDKEAVYLPKISNSFFGK